MALTITSENYESTIASGKPVVIDFWAEWCGPCRMLAPVLDEVAGGFADKAAFVTVDVDANGEIAQKYGVMSIPDVIVFKNGAPAAQSLRFVAAATPQAFFDPSL